MKLRLPELVEDWRDAWRWFSVRAMTLALALQGAWVMVPTDLRAKVPEQAALILTLLLLAAGIVGRLVKQPPTKEPQ